MKILRSLRARSLIAGTILFVILLISSLSARQQLLAILDSNLEIATEFDIFKSNLIAAREPLQALESRLYLYTILLNDSQKKRTKQYIEEVKYQSDELTTRSLYQKFPKFKSDLKRFNHSFTQVEEVTLKILNFEHKQRYKTISVLVDKLTPQHDLFTATLNDALNHLEFYDEDNPKIAELKDLYQQLHFRWIQHVSEVRLLITAKAGILGQNFMSFQQFHHNTLNYEKEIIRLLKRISHLSDQNTDKVETPSLLEIKQITASRFTIIKDLLDISYTEQMREDIKIIRFQLTPLFEQANNSLNILERRFHRLFERNMQDNRSTLKDVSESIALFFVFLITMFLSLYFVFEFWLRKPLEKLANAIKIEGEESGSVELKKQGIEEIDSLIIAFNQMRIQIRDRQKRITSILQNAGEGIITIDKQGIIESFNFAAEKMFKQNSDDMIGKNVSLLMPAADASQHDRYINNYLDSKQAKILNRSREQVAIKSSGEEFPIEIYTSEIVLDNNQQIFIAVIHDISERKLNEAIIEASKEEAERNNALLVKKNILIEDSLKQLLETQVQLVEAEKMASLGGLVAGIAHEINTPIGVCVTAGSTLEHSIVELDELIKSNQISKRHLLEFIDDSNESLKIILNNLSRAAELIKSFKQVAVDQSSDEVRLFNLKEYIDEIVLNLRPKLKRTHHKIVIECSDELMVNSYPGAVSQILTNLIMNSLIHGFDEDQWGTISITITQNDNKLHCIYEDNGKGMNEEQQSKIFDPFYTTKRSAGGSGLGMNVVYNLTNQQLKGKISCTSSPGKGVQFDIHCAKDISVS